MKGILEVALMRWRIRVVLGTLEGDVLDVGCGTNELVKTYRTLKEGQARAKTESLQYTPLGQAVGVDVHPWEGVDMVIENSANLPFADESFDTVCCIAALNHIPEREAFLREAKRLLRPHGRLVLTMLPPGISRVWHFLFSPWDTDQHARGIKQGEVYGLSFNTMKSLLKTAGFSITRADGFMLGINTLYVAEKS